MASDESSPGSPGSGLEATRVASGCWTPEFVAVVDPLLLAAGPLLAVDGVLSEGLVMLCRASEVMRDGLYVTRSEDDGQRLKRERDREWREAGRSCIQNARPSSLPSGPTTLCHMQLRHPPRFTWSRNQRRGGRTYSLSVHSGVPEALDGFERD